MFRSAVISPDGVYRYHLQRIWDSARRVCWVMLNPSTADAEKDDATIRRCMRFARDWGYGGIDVVNLYAYRATDPKQLKLAGYPEGPENSRYIQEITEDPKVALVVAAWGRNAPPNATVVLSRNIYVLKRTDTPELFPWHPLRLHSATQPVIWRPF